ncbi:MAG TPA: DUF58 domain-containing protein [Chloroflexota bacterium]|nr:DUF58 domain-containing protein [Chloroflexota bacterium]
MAAEPAPADYFGFDGAFLKRLEQLALLNRRSLIGAQAGPRRSPRRGSSVEFADFREYSPGDDFRRIDWNTFARLDRLFLRLYRAEEMTTLTVFLDHSRSMAFGSPSKLLTAARLAAILTYIGLHNDDRVAVAGWGDRVDRYFPARGGTASIPLVWRSIAAIAGSPDGPTDFAALQRHARMQMGSGIAVVLSDLMTDTDWQAGLQALRGAGQEVNVVQILSPEEIAPGLRGDWKLRDSETGREVEITTSPRLLKRYHEALDAHLDAVRAFCRRQGIAHLQISSDIPVDSEALRALRTARMIGA